MAKVKGSKYRSGKVNNFVPVKNGKNGRKFNVVPIGSGGAGGRQP